MFCDKLESKKEWEDKRIQSLRKEILRLPGYISLELAQGFLTNASELQKYYKELLEELKEVEKEN